MPGWCLEEGASQNQSWPSSRGSNSVSWGKEWQVRCVQVWLPTMKCVGLPSTILLLPRNVQWRRGLNNLACAASLTFLGILPCQGRADDQFCSWAWQFLGQQSFIFFDWLISLATSLYQVLISAQHQVYQPWWSWHSSQFWAEDPWFLVCWCGSELWQGCNDMATTFACLLPNFTGQRLDSLLAGPPHQGSPQSSCWWMWLFRDFRRACQSEQRVLSSWIRRIIIWCLFQGGAQPVECPWGAIGFRCHNKFEKERHAVDCDSVQFLCGSLQSSIAKVCRKSIPWRPWATICAGRQCFDGGLFSDLLHSLSSRSVCRLGEPYVHCDRQVPQPLWSLHLCGTLLHHNIYGSLLWTFGEAAEALVHTPAVAIPGSWPSHWHGRRWAGDSWWRSIHRTEGFASRVRSLHTSVWTSCPESFPRHLENVII